VPATSRALLRRNEVCPGPAVHGDGRIRGNDQSGPTVRWVTSCALLSASRRPALAAVRREAGLIHCGRNHLKRESGIAQNLRAARRCGGQNQLQGFPARGYYTNGSVSRLRLLLSPQREGKCYPAAAARPRQRRSLTSRRGEQVSSLGVGMPLQILADKCSAGGFRRDARACSACFGNARAVNSKRPEATPRSPVPRRSA